MSPLRRAAVLLAAVAVVGAVQLGLATPASAAAPAITVRSPSRDAFVQSAQVTVEGDVRMPNDGSVTGDVVIEILRQAEVVSRFTVPGNNARIVRFEEEAVLERNAPYVLRVQATGRDNIVDPTPETARVEMPFNVDANPAAPTGVRVEVDKGKRTVAIAWDANPEPDIIGYQVQRQPAKQSWSVLTETTGTSAKDETTAQTGGEFAYRVVAVRRSADPNKVLVSAPSASANASVPAPPTPRSDVTFPPPGSQGGTPSTGAPGSRSSAGAVATQGRADLSGYSSLLAQARASQARRSTPGEPDTGFEEELPFGEMPAEEGGGEDEPVAAGRFGSTTTEDVPVDRFRSLAFLAGGLLATVLLMHVLWVRGEVKRADQLEMLPADDELIGAGRGGSTAR